MDVERTAGMDPTADYQVDRRLGTGADAGVGQGAAVGADAASFVRREERLRTDTVRVPVEMVRITKHVVVEQVTRVVEVRREELRVETLPIADGGGTNRSTTDTQPFEMVLLEEEFEIVKRVVPRERVRVTVDRLAEQHSVGAELRREEVVVEPIGSIQPVD